MDRYSRLVAWLKVLLPLTALALLSTLFLLSRTVDPVASIPFADAEINDRVRDQQITGPFFSGTSDAGDLISVSANTMRTGADLSSTVDGMSAQIDLASGTRVVLFADAGSFDMKQAQSDLTGNVILSTSTGFEVTTDALEADFGAMALSSPGPVQASGPLGRLDAGRMRMNKTDTDGNVHLIFTNGVKLVYDPRELEE